MPRTKVPSAHFRAAALALSLAAAPVLLAAHAAPPDPGPSGFGRWDRAGASNLMAEPAAIRAANLIRRGRVVELGRDYRAEMPLDPALDFSLVRTRTDTGAVTRIDSHLCMPLTRAGTYLAGLGHLGSAGPEARFYNDLTLADPASGDNPGALGVERLKPIFTRGVLIDMVTVRGRPLEAGEEITVADIETALDWFGLEEPGRGDAVIFHTGWGRHWMADNAAYLAASPGIGPAAAEWLMARGVALVATDAWSVERQPPGVMVPRGWPVTRRMSGERGILMHLSLETERLIDAEIGEFAYIFAPLPVVGASGSPGAPLAAY